MKTYKVENYHSKTTQFSTFGENTSVYWERIVFLKLPDEVNKIAIGKTTFSKEPKNLDPQ